MFSIFKTKNQKLISENLRLHAEYAAQKSKKQEMLAAYLAADAPCLEAAAIWRIALDAQSPTVVDKAATLTQATRQRDAVKQAYQRELFRIANALEATTRAAILDETDSFRDYEKKIPEMARKHRGDSYTTERDIPKSDGGIRVTRMIELETNQNAQDQAHDICQAAIRALQSSNHATLAEIDKVAEQFRKQLLLVDFGKMDPIQMTEDTFRVNFGKTAPIAAQGR
jgi:hypothetical protein